MAEGEIPLGPDLNTFTDDQLIIYVSGIQSFDAFGGHHQIVPVRDFYTLPYDGFKGERSYYISERDPGLFGRGRRFNAEGWWTRQKRGNQAANGFDFRLDYRGRYLPPSLWTLDEYYAEQKSKVVLCRVARTEFLPTFLAFLVAAQEAAANQAAGDEQGAAEAHNPVLDLDLGGADNQPQADADDPVLGANQQEDGNGVFLWQAAQEGEADDNVGYGNVEDDGYDADDEGDGYDANDEDEEYDEIDDDDMGEVVDELDEDHVLNNDNLHAGEEGYIADVDGDDDETENLYGGMHEDQWWDVLNVDNHEVGDYGNDYQDGIADVDMEDVEHEMDDEEEIGDA